MQRTAQRRNPRHFEPQGVDPLPDPQEHEGRNGDGPGNEQRDKNDERLHNGDTLATVRSRSPCRTQRVQTGSTSGTPWPGRFRPASAASPIASSYSAERRRRRRSTAPARRPSVHSARKP